MNNPESIPLYDIKEDIRLLVLAREFHTAHGSIDAFGVDREGEVYLIETKLYRNADKRYIVAQVLDYGASLWRSYGDFSEFMRELDIKVQEKFKESAIERVKEFFNIEDEDAAHLLENVRQNLSKGNYRFVVLLDKVDDKLKDLILFINENSRFDLFGVEFEYYKYEEYEILIPKLFGAEVKKDIGTPASGSREGWDESKFLGHAKQTINDDQIYEILAEIYRFTKENADTIDFGTGHESGSFTFKLEYPQSKSGLIALFTVWTSGKIRFRFGNIRRRGDEKTAKLFFDKLSTLHFASKWDKKELVRDHGPSPSAALIEAFPDKKTISAFKLAILDFKKEVKK